MIHSYRLVAFLAFARAYWKAFKAEVSEGYLRGQVEGLSALTAARTYDRGQTGAGNLIGLIIGIAVAVIVTVGVAIPITNDVIAQSNLTGITALIVGFIPVMLGLMIFVATAAPIMSRT